MHKQRGTGLRVSSPSGRLGGEGSLEKKRGFGAALGRDPLLPQGCLEPR